MIITEFERKVYIQVLTLRIDFYKLLNNDDEKCIKPFTVNYKLDV